MATNSQRIKENCLTATGSTATTSDAKTKHSAMVMPNACPITPAIASPYSTGPTWQTYTPARNGGHTNLAVTLQSNKKLSFPDTTQV